MYLVFEEKKCLFRGNIIVKIFEKMVYKWCIFRCDSAKVNREYEDDVRI